MRTQQHITKLCECGCGQPAPLSDRTARGYLKGQPLRFINGHAWRGRKHSEESKDRVRAARIGTSATPETREKMRQAHLGTKHTPERRAAIGSAQRGESNHHWNGGVTTPNMAARGTVEYKEWRTRVFERDDFTCQECGARGVRLRAHHIMSFAGHKELRLAIDNGVTLCEPCHKNAHSHEQARTTKTTARRTTCVVT